MGDLKTNIVLKLVNRVTEPVRKIQNSFLNFKRKTGPALADVDRKFNALSNTVGRTSGGLAVLGAAGAWAFKRQFLDTAASFEQFTAVLEAVEGSSSKAKSSMDWVSNFAAKTPYELSEVTDAFVKLRAYGMNPMNGILTDLGDASSAMGKPLMQSIEAIADAVTGEYERLKEFGIKAQTKGNKTRFLYTDSDGKQQYKIVDKTNRAMIESTLRTIWNEKYSGAMEKQSRTWKGMISNLSDQWTRFKIKVMEAGLFDWMKLKLSELLKVVDKMAADGSLQRIAVLWGNNIRFGMEKAFRAGQKFWHGFLKVKNAFDKVATAMGGYDRLLIAVGVTMATKTIVQVISLGASLVKLGKIILPAVGTAFSLMVKTSTAAIATLSGSISSLYAVLSPVIAALAVIMAPAVATGAIAKGSELVGKTVGKWQISTASHERLREMLDSEGMSGLGPGSSSAQQLRTEIWRREAAEMEKMFSGGRSETAGRGEKPSDQMFSGHMKIEIESAAPVRVTELKASHGLDIDMDAGRMMVAH